MRLVTLTSKDLRIYTVDGEMLQKAGRPCVLIVQLKYKGHRHNFAVPLRSNINPSTPKNQYFPLPPRSSTRPKYRHGIHYAKMFPIDKRKAHPFRTDGNIPAQRIKQIININEKQIIRECQEYLTRYEAGEHPAFSTDIDLLISQIQKTG